MNGLPASQAIDLPAVSSLVEGRDTAPAGSALHEFAETTSTNLIAAKHPAWNVVRADTQSAGRGRFHRQWVSDAGGRKLAGLLTDHFQPGLAVVGIGINMRNQSETRDGGLNGHVVRLAAPVSAAPLLRDLAVRVLASLKSVWLEVQHAGPEQILPRVNALWDLPRRVRLDPEGPVVIGEFNGVDARGRLLLRLDEGVSIVLNYRT